MYSIEEAAERRPLLETPSSSKSNKTIASSSSSNVLISSSSSSSSGTYRKWTIFVSIVALLCAVGLVAVSFNWVYLARSSTEVVSMNRLELAKAGKLAYKKLSDDEVATLFDEFQTKFQRTYATDKEAKTRFKNFLEFLRNVDSRNEKEQDMGGSAVHGVTIFSDMSDSEMSGIFMGYVPVSTPEVLALSKKPMLSKYGGKSNSVDWSGIYTTAIKQQGYCGSCWAFAAVMQIESDGIRAGLITTKDDLSTEQLVACDNEDNKALSGDPIIPSYILLHIPSHMLLLHIPLTFPSYHCISLQIPLTLLFQMYCCCRICTESWLLRRQYRDCLCICELRRWYRTRIRLSLHIVLGKGITHF